jgi:hypothetical protein
VSGRHSSWKASSWIKGEYGINRLERAHATIQERAYMYAVLKNRLEICPDLGSKLGFDLRQRTFPNR